MPSLFFSSCLSLALQEYNKYSYKEKYFLVRVEWTNITNEMKTCQVNIQYYWVIAVSNSDEDIFLKSQVSLLLAQLNVFMCNIYILAQSSPRCNLQTDGNPCNDDIQPSLLGLKPVFVYPYMPCTPPNPSHCTHKPATTHNVDVTFSTGAVMVPQTVRWPVHTEEKKKKKSYLK